MTQPDPRPYRYVDGDGFCLSARLLPDLNTGGVTETLSITIEGSDEPQSVHVRASDAPTVAAGIVRAAGQQSAVPAGPAPATDRPTVPTDWIDGHPQLEAIAAAVWERCEHHDSGLVIDDPRNIAVAALAAVLPAPDQQTTVLAEQLVERCPDHGCVEPAWEDGCHCEVVPLLRRLAGEAQQDAHSCGNCSGVDPATCLMNPDRARVAQQDPTQDGEEAHPPEHTWAAELYDPVADEWVPGTRYAVRDRAVNHLEHARAIGPAWKDGTPTRRRLVRATTTYTVEDPAAVARSGQPDTDEETDRG